MPRCSTLKFAGLLALSVGCGAASERVVPRATSKELARARLKHAAEVTSSALRAHRFAEVSDVIGPYVGRDGDAALAAWAEAESNGRGLFVAPIDQRGIPGPASRVASIGPELDLVLVRGFGEASAKAVGQPRFAVVTTRRSAKMTAIDVTALRADGTAVWGPTLLAERNARVLWVGFVSAGAQPLLLWAEQPSGSKAGEPASVYGLAIAVDGKQTAPTLVTAKACVWQVAATAGAAALASVRPSANGCSSGSVAFDLLSATGKPAKTLELGGRAALDLDLVASADAFVLAWSDREQIEPRAMTAVVDSKGGLRSPAAPAVPALGEQAVLSLVAGSGPETPAFLVWENLAERPEGARYFEISALNAAGRGSGAHARLLYDRVDGSAPELAPFSGGVAALTLAPACGVDDSCEGNLPVPTFVALDRGLELRASEPLLLDSLGGRAADLSWGLTCQAQGCFALDRKSVV